MGVVLGSGVATTPRRDGRWSLLSASTVTELSHRTCRTLVAAHPNVLVFPAPTQDLLTLKVLGEAYLYTPPLQSGKRLDPETIRERDEDLIRYARDVWDSRKSEAYILTTPAQAHLCSSIERIRVQLEQLQPTQTVNLLPVGAWMTRLLDVIV